MSVNALVYIPFHLHGICRSSIPMLWPNCKVPPCSTFLDTLPKPTSAPNKGSKQEQQGITTHTWIPHTKPIQLSRPVPQTP